MKFADLLQEAASDWDLEYPDYKIRINDTAAHPLIEKMKSRTNETLETVNPKGGFLILPPCLRFSPNRREFFCRKNWLKRGAKPAIPRKLLSTKKT